MNIFSWFAKPNKPAEVFTPTLVEPIFDGIVPRGTIAVVLGGGGSFGPIEVGAMLYLEAVGLAKYITFYVGTSVGGLNALLLALHHGNYAKAVEVWKKIKCDKDIYTGKVPTDILSAAGRGAAYAAGDRSGVVKPDGLYKILIENFYDKPLNALPKQVFITATDISRKQRVVFSSYSTPETPCAIAGQATSAIPVLFPHVKYNGMVLADGGIANNNPVRVALDNGANKIILIECTPEDMGEPQKIKDDFIDDGVASLATALHLAEDDNEKAVESGKFPLLALYPENMERMPKNILAFDTVQRTMQYGWDLAAKYFTREKLLKFAQE